jgi:Flp pilus assembly protein TadG
MNQHNKSFLRRAHKDQRGQALVMVAFMMVGFFAMAAFVIDFGRIYFSFRELQASTDAAALAGAQTLPSTSSTNGAVATATLYSSLAGNKNTYSNLPNVTFVSGYPKLRCLTSTSIGLPCLDSSGNIVSSGGANAIQVMQQVSVPLTFASVIGTSSVTLTASATASMRGAARAPYNVAIVVDSTPSMRSRDTDGLGCSGTKEYCALQGVQTLMGELSPCGASQSSCGSATNGNVLYPVDEISLLTFPAVTTSTAPDDYCSPSGTVSTQAYPLPTGPPYTTLTGTPTPTYQIVNFSSDYRSSDTANSLNTSSNLTKGAGGTGTGCNGLQDNGNRNTYYAGAIYNAASLLLNQQSLRNPNSLTPAPTQNAMIILGDGDSNSVTLNGDGVVDLASTASRTLTTYPSYVDQCQQAVYAANWATSKGITVYSVAYDAQGSGTCAYDTSASPPVNKAGITGCQTMEQLASSHSKFYTSNSSCELSDGNTTMSLNAIFTAIAGDMTVARLVPDNTN